jgi:urea transport system substrate-binding protein
MRISRRIMAGLATASLAVTATSCGGGGTSGSFDDTVTVGILHSLSGTMAISESTLVDTEKMAIEEINAAGGVKVGGKSYKIEYIVEDGASDWPTFAETYRPRRSSCRIWRLDICK